MLDRHNMHTYQDTTVEHIINTPFAGVFLDMGLGKTVSSLTAIDFLIYQDMEIDRCLVIAPKRVAESVWTAEIKKWAHLRHLKITRVIGTQKQRKAALRENSDICLLYTSPSPRDKRQSRMPSSA